MSACFLLLVIARFAVVLSGSTPGHVFILHTDIRYLACDAWLLPVSSSMYVDQQWGLHADEVPERPKTWGTSVRLLQAVSEADRPRRHFYSHPRPWLAHVLGEDQSVEEKAAVLRQFLAEAAMDLNSSRFGRALPLLAVPVFGTAGATSEGIGGSARTGEILVRMLTELLAFTREHSVDIALCTLDEAAFGAALNARRRADDTFEESRDTIFDQEVQRLATLLLEDRCSLFLGAGVSVNAGLPSWKQLLDLIATQLNYPEKDRHDLAHLNPLEAASVLEGAAGGSAAIKQITAGIIGGVKRHSLQHALFAGLPFNGCVTTNYDDLFERAMRFAGHDLAVLPTEIGTVVDRWVLKLHGDVHNPNSIVLTRSDYTRFSSLYAANEGVLQGLLLTQHVLFCGFSMRDENWCRLVDAVRSPFMRGEYTGRRQEANDHSEVNSDANGRMQLGIMREYTGRRQEANDHGEVNSDANGRMQLGTVLSLLHDPLFDSLWDGLLKVTAFDQIGMELPKGIEAGDAIAWHARNLEIFLDHLASAVEHRRCRILLNPKYATLLSPRSTALAAHIRNFLESLDEQSKTSGAFLQLVEVLLEMGLRTEEAQRLMGGSNIVGPYRARLKKLQNFLPSPDTISGTSKLLKFGKWKFWNSKKS